MGALHQLANLHDFLKEVRVKAEITQQEMAQKLNMTQSHVSKYETGRKIIDLETWVNWVRITNSEFQAALLMFGPEIFSNVSQVLTVVPAIANHFVTVQQLFH